jgi:hypothetical protein
MNHSKVKPLFIGNIPNNLLFQCLNVNYNGKYFKDCIIFRCDNVINISYWTFEYQNDLLIHSTCFYLSDNIFINYYYIYENNGIVKCFVKNELDTIFEVRNNKVMRTRNNKNEQYDYIYNNNRLVQIYKNGNLEIQICRNGLLNYQIQTRNLNYNIAVSCKSIVINNTICLIDSLKRLSEIKNQNIIMKLFYENEKLSYISINGCNNIYYSYFNLMLDGIQFNDNMNLEYEEKV